ncbi:MAG: WHG domain-containing protein [Sporichthyaceae bacterium]
MEAAEHLADEVGLSRLTLTGLAQRLGVRQPSLYKHIESMEHLHRSISVRAKDELAGALGRAAVGRSRGDAIVSMSQAYRDWATAHPGRYAAAQRAPAPGDAHNEVASMAVVQVLTDVLAGYDLHGDDAIDAIRSGLHGFSVLETSGRFGLPLDIDRSYDRLVHGLLAALTSWDDEAGADEGQLRTTTQQPAPSPRAAAETTA